MAVAGIVQGVAVGIILQSWLVVAYAVAGSLVWNYAVRPLEESDLRKRFGDEFQQYRDTGALLDSPDTGVTSLSRSMTVRFSPFAAQAAMMRSRSGCRVEQHVAPGVPPISWWLRSRPSRWKPDASATRLELLFHS